MLALTFFVISFLYATVGFGGGSSYLAVLAISGIPFEVMPKIALICNLLVVTGSLYHFKKQNLLRKDLILPFIISSVPMAFLGGYYPIKEKTFLVLLSGSLIIAGLRLLIIPHMKESRMPKTGVAFVAGAGLGLLSGLVGLGGGIFLSPLMMNMGWGKAKEVAATACMFIFVNSLAGLAGQFAKETPGDITPYLTLFVAVIFGGQIGARLGTHPKVPQHYIQRGTAVLILIISSRLLLKLVSDF